ncbi:MAG: hypothetical protein NTW85_00355 [Methylococcales bacterium]|nr:hypothetical protein [Methylococcales bacterium]
MEIVCKNCNTSHFLSDDRIPLETKTGKCKKCGAAITVLGKNEANNFNAKESLKMAITQPEFEGTNVRQFLAHKGSVIIKEFREIARLRSNYYEGNEAYEKATEALVKARDAYRANPNNAKALDNYLALSVPENKNSTIIVSTLILAIVKGKDQQTIFGVKLEHIGTDEYSDETTVFIDFDELPELMESFDFIQSKADTLKPQKCDYTELIYSTKDDAQFGFFQDDEQEQTAFTKWQGKTAFLKLSDFLTLKNHLLKAQEHLISRGASIDNY